LDLVNRAPLPALPRTATAGAAFPSATGRLLLIPDGRLAQLTVVDTTVPTKAIVLKAAPNIEAIYFGWFDTVALVPSAARKSVLLYDLDAVGWAGEIALSGRPGRGAVNPEGDRLYLPLPDAQKIAIVDARYRRLTGYIPVSGSPQVIVLAGSYGICH
jgi:hypothetical protein